MTRLVFVFIGLFTCILIGFANSKKAAISFFQDKYLLAWNEDTVNSYQFALIKRDKFSYAITRKNGLKDTTEYYKGIYTYTSNTILLNFIGKQPNGIAPSLVLEASGNYLIQYSLLSGESFGVEIKKGGFPPKRMISLSYHTKTIILWANLAFLADSRSSINY